MYGGTPYYSELGWNQEEGEFNTASRWDGSMVCSIAFNGKTLLASWVNKAGSASNASWERTRLTIAVRDALGDLDEFLGLIGTLFSMKRTDDSQGKRHVAGLDLFGTEGSWALSREPFVSEGQNTVGILNMGGYGGLLMACFIQLQDENIRRPPQRFGRVA